jgi:Domain of unknown function (DUF4349)
MKTTRRAALAVTATVILSGLVGAAAGCGGGSASGGATSAAHATASGGAAGVQRLAAAAPPVETPSTGGGSAHTAARTVASLPAPRSAVVKTATLDLRVAHGRFGRAIAGLRGVATRFGGFVSRSSTSGTGIHSGSAVLRVPAARFGAALAAVEGLGRPTDENVRGQDVTQQFVDLDARLVNLRSQERALLRLMRRAQSVTDTIRVQTYLQNVELQMEEIQGRLTYLRDRTAMSTIAVSVHEAGRKPAPPAHASALWKAAARSLHTALAVVTSVIVGAGFVIPVAILALLAVLIGRLAARWAAPLVARGRGTAAPPSQDG